mmetsp:Transcript_47360/g.126753  ORF Transcript_47360/g.126753 Transcript_47360/m.126753 type:complete len:244 (+) Transcript_47360:952-1683(+)
MRPKASRPTITTQKTMPTMRTTIGVLPSSLSLCASRSRMASKRSRLAASMTFCKAVSCASGSSGTELVSLTLSNISFTGRSPEALAAASRACAGSCVSGLSGASSDIRSTAAALEPLKPCGSSTRPFKAAGTPGCCSLSSSTSCSTADARCSSSTVVVTFDFIEALWRRLALPKGWPPSQTSSSNDLQTTARATTSRRGKNFKTPPWKNIMVRYTGHPRQSCNGGLVKGISRTGKQSSFATVR